MHRESHARFAVRLGFAAALLCGLVLGPAPVRQVPYAAGHSDSLEASLSGIGAALLESLKPASVAEAAGPVNVTVSANTIWSNTALAVSQGDTITLSASGQWRPDTGQLVGPDGRAQPWPDNFLNLTDLGACASCATTNTPHYAALIAYIGSAPPAAGSYTSTAVLPEAQKVFFVGSSYSSTAANTGQLWLGFNDDAYSGNTGDNSGTVTATVTTTSASVPTQPAPPDNPSLGGPGVALPGSEFSLDPVNTLTGSFTYVHTDVAIAGRGPSPMFVRAYNGADNRGTLAGANWISPLGPGWTHNYAMHLASPGDSTADLLLVGAQGRTDRYTPTGGGAFAAPSGVNTTLVANQNLTYTATQSDQTKWTFDDRGRLISIADRYGNQSNMSYDANSRLQTITDPAARPGTNAGLTLAYDSATGLLASVTDWANRVVRYAYDTNNPPRLQNVTDRNNQVTHFAYDGTSQRLTSIADANNHVAVSMSYDGQGRVLHQWDAAGSDAAGQRTEFAYDASAACLTPTSPNPPVCTTTVTYPTTSFETFAPQQLDTYSNSQIAQHVFKPSAAETLTTAYSYTTSGFPSAVTDPRGNKTSFCYDTDYAGVTVAGSRGNLTRTISAPPASAENPVVTLVKYDAKSNVTQTIAPKGITVTNSSALLQNPCGTSFTTGPNTVVGTIASNGLFVTDLSYDATLGTELISVIRKYIDPELGGTQTATTKFEYGDSTNAGLVTRVIPPRGNTGTSPDYTYATTLGYGTSGNQAGMLVSVTDPLGNRTTYAYDAVGRRTCLNDPLAAEACPTTGAHTWTFAYDGEDRLTQATAPTPVSGGDALTTSATFDAVGNRLTLTDANGQITRYQYDPRDSLQQVIQSDNRLDPLAAGANKITTLYSYDRLGNLVRVDRAGAGSTDTSHEEVVDYAYDGLNRVRKETQYPQLQACWNQNAPNGSNTCTTMPPLVTQTTYDANSNRRTLVDAQTRTTTFDYDALNRLTTITYSDGQTPGVDYGYDANGNRSSMDDGTGQTTFSYDELDRLLSVAGPGSQTVQYRYDPDGNRRKVIYPDATAVNYSFDKASRLQSLQDWANRTTSYGYFADGLLNTISNINNTSATFSYDNARRLTQVVNETTSNAVINKHIYTADAVGNRTELIETLAPVGGGAPTQHTLSYAYDNLYRLTSASTGSGTGPDLSGIVPVGVKATSATISWLTSGPSTSQVEYGTTSSLGSGTTLDTALVRSHGQALTGLSPATTYYFAVVSKDAAGNQTTSSTVTFTTQPTAAVGDANVEPSLDSNPAGTAQAFPYTAGSTSSINRLFIYLDATNTASMVAVGLYNDVGGHPQTLQTAGLITNPANGAWNSVTVPAVNVTSGTQYWLAVLTPPGGGTIKFRDQAGAGSSETSNLTNLTGLPILWATGQTWTTGFASLFAGQVSNSSLDTQPPAVDLTSQTNEQTVSGASVSVSATASDAVGVAAVQFLVDDLSLGAPDTAAPFTVTWDTTAVPNGGHTLSARARDAAGNIGNATKVYVVVSNSGNAPPAVLLGNHVKETNITDELAGQADAFKYTATTNGMATQLHVYLDGLSAASQVQVGLYSDSAGHPGTLLTQGVVFAPIADGWNAVPVPAVNVTANTSYWIAVLSPAGSGTAKVRYQGTGSGGTNDSSSQTTLSALPSSWSSGATSTQQSMSAYVVAVPQTGGGISTSTSYSYDPTGNRLSKVLNGSSTSSDYDRADRITSAGGVTYHVNDAGNLDTRGTDTFAYDQANRLISATVGGATSTYRYDGGGKRTSKTVSGATTSFQYDVGSDLPMLLDDGVRKYVYGAAGLAYSVEKGTGVVQVYHVDGLGSVRALTDNAGAVVQAYQTDEFGLPTLSQGASTQPFGYTGEQRDPEDGFVYLRARIYDPSIGRFIQRDMIFGSPARPESLNRFVYVLSNPVRLIDPAGLFPSENKPAPPDSWTEFGRSGILIPGGAAGTPKCDGSPGGGQGAEWNNVPRDRQYNPAFPQGRYVCGTVMLPGGLFGGLFWMWIKVD